MRIRNLYDPPTMKDREITVTGEDTSWLYPPTPRPDGLANVTWQKKDGSYLIGIRNNLTVPIPVGVTVLTRLCGFNDRSLVTLLQHAGLPPVFAASDHPY